MERLTKRDKNNVPYWCGINGESSSDIKGNIYGKAITKLAEYEDAEEQGLLIRLPCKIEDDIYVIPSEVNYRLNKSFGAKGLNAVCRQVVDHIEFNSYGYLISTNEGMTVHREEAFGETWFLTREEAEQALKQMGE